MGKGSYLVVKVNKPAVQYFWGNFLRFNFLNIGKCPQFTLTGTIMLKYYFISKVSALSISVYNFVAFEETELLHIFFVFTTTLTMNY